MLVQLMNECWGKPNNKVGNPNLKNSNKGKDFERVGYVQGYKDESLSNAENSKSANVDKLKRFRFVKAMKEHLERFSKNEIITLEGKSYVMNYDDQRYRDCIRVVFWKYLQKPYDWFREERGSKNWVLYRTDLFCVKSVNSNSFDFMSLLGSGDMSTVKLIHYLEYKGDYVNEVEFPINMSSCFLMFRNKRFNQETVFTDNNNGNLENVFDTVAMFFNSTFSKGYCLTESLCPYNSINMNGMFYGAMFKEDSALSETFSTEKVFSMSYMFYKTHLHDDFVLPETFSTGNVIDMSRMFSNSYFCGNILLSKANFCTENVLDFEEMFAYSKFVGRLILPENFTLKNAVYTRHMFFGSNVVMEFSLRSYTNTEIVNVLKGSFK